MKVRSCKRIEKKPRGGLTHACSPFPCDGGTRYVDAEVYVDRRGKTLLALALPSRCGGDGRWGHPLVWYEIDGPGEPSALYRMNGKPYKNEEDFITNALHA